MDPAPEFMEKFSMRQVGVSLPDFIMERAERKLRDGADEFFAFFYPLRRGHSQFILLSKEEFVVCRNDAKTNIEKQK